MGGPTLTPGLSRPPDRTSTVARSSASRSGFSQPSGITAVPSSIRRVRWVAAARTATGEEMPYCRCRWRTQALSKPSSSPSSMTRSVVSCPGAGSSPSNRPMVRKPSFSRGTEGSGTPLLAADRRQVFRSPPGLGRLLEGVRQIEHVLVVPAGAEEGDADRQRVLRAGEPGRHADVRVAGDGRRTRGAVGELVGDAVDLEVLGDPA